MNTAYVVNQQRVERDAARSQRLGAAYSVLRKQLRNAMGGEPTAPIVWTPAWKRREGDAPAVEVLADHLAGNDGQAAEHWREICLLLSALADGRGAEPGLHLRAAALLAQIEHAFADFHAADAADESDEEDH